MTMNTDEFNPIQAAYEPPKKKTYWVKFLIPFNIFSLVKKRKKKRHLERG